MTDREHTRMRAIPAAVAGASLAAALLSIAGVLVVVAFFARPIADDFPAFNQIARIGWGVIGYDYTTFSGRFANNILYASPYILLGDRALWVVPLGIVLTLASSLAYLGSCLRPHSLATRLTGAAIGAGTGIAAVAVQPGFYDVFAWYTSSTLYLASAAGVALVAALLVGVVRADGRRRLLLTVGLGLAAFFLQGLSETSGLAVLGLATLALIASGTVARSLLRPHRLVVVVFFVASLAGFLTSTLAPGRIGRISVQTVGEPLGIPALVAMAVRDIPHFLGMFTTPLMLVVVALGLAVGLLLPAYAVRTRLLVALAAIVGTLGSIFITSLLVHYGYNGGAVPVRSWAFPTLVLVVSIVAVLAVIVAGVSQRSAVASGILCAIIVVSAGGFVLAWKKTSTDYVSAVTLRAALLDTRRVDVAAQVAAGADEIEIMPAPVLLPMTDSTDYLLPGSSGPDWTEHSIERYYGVDGMDTVALEQEPTYCRPNFSNAFWAIESCEQLAADRRDSE